MIESIKLDGLGELNKELKKMDARVAKKYSRAGLAAGATLVRREMRQRAPVDTGKLKRNIRYSIKRIKSGGFRARVGVRRTYKKDDVYYAHYIEYGTTPHKIPSENVGRGRYKRKNKATVAIGGKVYSSVDHPGVSARPFLRPAFQATWRKSIDVMGHTIWKKIKAHQQ